MTPGQIAEAQREIEFFRSQSVAWHTGYLDQKHIPSRSLIDTGKNEYDHGYNPHATRSQEWSDYRDGVKYAYENTEAEDE